MVSTRNHPKNFPPPTPSPSKSSRGTPSRRTQGRNGGKRALPSTWTHTPSYLTLIWLGVSLPLVIWDFSYVFLRPRSMPGGPLHWPLWRPYALYGEVDYTYGFVGLEAQDGFIGAQSVLNLIETLMYAWYLWVVLKPHGQGAEAKKSKAGRGAPSSGAAGWLGQPKSVGGGAEVRNAVLVAFAASIMTISKTILYWLREYYSSWSGIGHNELFNLIFVFIIPNGLWLIVPTYMAYVFGAEILEGLEIAAAAGPGPASAPSNDVKSLTTGAGEDDSDSDEESE
ncbi:MAG: hypothetical protein M4579_005037 [Chaenotheca gracillima]|nr:MAG: hypothetical protein M4579_005037 [Chaenotheca gracillima]